MPFTPPSLAELYANTLSLDAHVSTAYGRYAIVSGADTRAVSPGSFFSAGSAANPSPSSFDTLIARVNKVATCQTERTSQRDVFVTLLAELNQIRGDESQKKQGTLFLLGALLHRYFRIIKEYEAFNSFFTTCDPLSSNLFRSIREALQLKSEVSHANFRKMDMAALDSLTIVNALEVFKDNMYAIDSTTKQPNYMNYLHFQKDENFQSYLEAIINEHKTKDLNKGKDSLIHQFNGIRFLESLVIAITTESKQIEEGITKLVESLQKQHTVFKQLRMEQLTDHVEKTVENAVLKETLLDLLATPYMREQYSQCTDYDSLLQLMKTCHSTTLRYTILGGYSMLLRSNMLSDKTRFQLFRALKTDQVNPGISTENMRDSVELLSCYVETHSSLTLNCSFFGGGQQFKTRLANLQQTLASELQKAKTTTATPLI